MLCLMGSSIGEAYLGWSPVVLGSLFRCSICSFVVIGEVLQFRESCMMSVGLETEQDARSCHVNYLPSSKQRRLESR